MGRREHRGTSPLALSATIEISPEKTDLSAPMGGRRHTVMSAVRSFGLRAAMQGVSGRGSA